MISAAALVGAVGALFAPVVDFDFTDVSASAGLTSFVSAFGIATGVSAVDYDNDGFTDIYLPTGSGGNRLYRNLGNGQFADIAATVGLIGTEAARGALWFDYDADGDLDLLLTRDGGSSVLSLYRQDSPTAFTNMTASAGLTFTSGTVYNPHVRRQGGGVCVGDLNNDGYLDICHCYWNGPVRVLLNDGLGKFVDISASSGVGAFLRFYWQPYIIDINGDGWNDLLLNVDFEPNMLWLNQGNNTFVQVAPAVGYANSMNDMGVTAGDYDNDGDFDFYISNIYEIDAVTQLQKHNVLMRNDSSAGTIGFTEVSIASSVDNGGWGWGISFSDVNRDGWLDIAETNGYFGWTHPSKLFLNPGTAPFVFSEVGGATGFNDTNWGSSLVAFDYDRDGDQDLLQACNDGPLRLYRTNLSGASAGRHYLTVKPRRLGLNRFAVGATVRVTTGGLTQMRYLSCGTSCLGQEPFEAFFGLGNNPTVDELLIEWPDGAASVLHDITADRVLTLTFGVTGDLDLDGDVDALDAKPFLDCMTGPGSGAVIYAPGCGGADFTDDGDVDLDDFAELARLIGA